MWCSSAMATKQCLCCWTVEKRGRSRPKRKDAGSDCIRRKVVVVGDRGAGKTCLLIRFQDRHTGTDYVPTVFESCAMDFHHRGRKVELILSDTAGEEEYAGLRQLSYKDADAVIVCFALDDPGSLQSVLSKWIPEVTTFCGDLPVILVGTKKESRDQIRRSQSQHRKVAIDYESGQEVARRVGARHYVECSARSGLGVVEVFSAVVDATCPEPNPSRGSNQGRRKKSE